MKLARVLAACFCALMMLSQTETRAQGAQGAPSATGATGATDDAALGLWFYQTSFPTGLAGELSVSRNGDRWRASIAGVDAEGVANGANLRIEFPNEGGVLRGVLNARGQLERAYWQRREITDDPRYSEGSAQAYAMPLTLRAAGADRWRAAVAPLPDPLTLYLNIFRDESGVLKAVLRNPEQHHHGPAMQLIVSRDGDRLRLGQAAAPGQGDLSATLRGDRIEMHWDDVNGMITMTRATPAQTALFTARPRTDPPYVYRRPQHLDDGWPTARARDLGVDEAALARAVQRIIDIDPSSQRAWLIHSIAVAYRGRLILDEYFYGYDAATPHDMRSASKTFSSVILGAVMMEGRVNISPDTRLYPLLASMGPFANPDPRKDRITLGHALTHSTGLECDDAREEEPLSPGNEGLMQSQRAEPNWWRFTLNLRSVYDPGAHYAYCSGGINLAGAALTTATGEWLPELFDRTIARPLQFQSYYWNLMPNGEGYIGGGAFVRTRDFLKIGQAYLDGGVWNGRRIATQAWVRDAMAPHARISEQTTGLTGDAFANFYFDTDEGYAWHHVMMRSGQQHYPIYHGNGNGGQLLMVVPQFDLVVMFTAGNYRQGLWNRERDDIVGDMIIPALGRGPR